MMNVDMTVVQPLAYTLYKRLFSLEVLSAFGEHATCIVSEVTVPRGVKNGCMTITAGFLANHGDGI